MNSKTALIERLITGTVSTRDLLHLVRVCLRILENHGIKIADFDHKGRTFYDLKVYGKKAYIVFSDEKEA